MTQCDDRDGMDDLHDLQRLFWPAAGRPEQLYLAEGSRGFHVDGDCLCLEAEAVIHADSYFNAFFPAYWTEFTAVRRIGIRCRGRGPLQVAVQGHRQDGTTILLEDWWPAAPERGAHRWVCDLDAREFVRLSVSVRASGPADLQDLAFVTDSAPRRRVQLHVGVVTHDRERQLAACLSGLLAAEGLARLTVINQGAAFQRQDLRALSDDPRVRVIRQVNCGGSGGFARAMVEALEDTSGPTHMLLMDDDVELDPRVLERVLCFAGHAEQEVALGGQAIELERPRLLQEAWGQLGAGWLPQMVGTGQDLGAVATLGLWHGVARPQYNGWWFCVMPLSAIRACGLPNPVFIRWDDIEYGLRLFGQGVPLVPLPGVGVWHASTHYKHVGSAQYYELRNLLVAAAAHPAMAPLPAVMQILGWPIHHLLVHRYRAAAASILAVSDFLAGPERVMAGAGVARHRAVLRHLGAIPLPERKEQPGLEGLNRPAPFVSGRSDVLTPRRAVGLMWRILHHGGRVPVSAVQIGAPDPVAIGGSAYLLAQDPQAETCLVMRPRPGMFLRLLLSALRAGLGYALFRRRAARAWRRALPDLQDRARWQAEFEGRLAGEGER